MKTVYYCEKCGAPFDDWQECMDHEYTHPQIEKTTLEYAGPNEIAPQGIEIRFNNGALGHYYLDEIIESPVELETEKEKPAEGDQTAI